MKSFIAALSLLLTAAAVQAQAMKYTMTWTDPSSHLYHLTLASAPAPGEAYTEFAMPAWRPGRYIEQRFAAGVSDFAATDDQGKALEWNKTGRDTWRVKSPASGEIHLSYKWYANEMDAGSSVLNHSMAYFNGANLFIYQPRLVNERVELKVLNLPADWKGGTALKQSGPGLFTAADYHEFVDSPTILSPTLKQLTTTVAGTTFHFHFQGRFIGGKETEDSLLARAGKLISEQAAVFGGLPMPEYHFLVLLLPYNMRHAVEHTFSSCYALPETVTTDAKSISGMLGILSHEFWHLWNVKRIRPAALWPYNYQQMPYTSLHWFTEGVTDYYTDLILVRAGLISREDYFKNLGTALTSLENSYAATRVSPSQASFDSWLSGSDYADPHLQTSYYPLGKRVGLLLDLKLRAATGGKVNMDEVFRSLWREYYSKGLGVPEDGIKLTVNALTGESWDAFFNTYVDGPGKADWEKAFAPYGLEYSSAPNKAALWTKLGIDRIEKGPGAAVITLVNPCGEAAKAGLGDGDVILSLNGKEPGKLDEKDFFSKLEDKDEISLKVLRDGAELEIKWDHFEKNEPVVLTVKLSERLKEKERLLLDGWLNSTQSPR